MEKKLYISYLNVTAALAVVLLHTNHKFWAYAEASYWNTANIIEAVFYFAVPIFFMISGVTLIDYNQRYTTEAYFVKRIERTFIPFLAWSLIGKLYMIIRHRQELPTFNWVHALLLVGLVFILMAQKAYQSSTTPMRISVKVTTWFAIVYVGMRLIDSESTNFLNVINQLLHTQYVPIFWFFIPLFAMYLSIPVLSKIDATNRQSVFGWGLLVVFFGDFVLRFVLSFSDVVHFNSNFHLPLFSGYLWFVVAGYYIDRYPLSVRFRRVIYVAGIVGLLAHIIGTYYYSHSVGAVNSQFKGYLNVPSVLYAVAIFTWFKCHAKEWVTGLNRLVQWFASETFGVYLIHWMVINAAEYLLKINPHSIVYRTVGGVLIFIVSTLIIKLLKRMPFVAEILP
ncbi:MAG: acyltransferase [Aerococcaceae bacterium]|nr:acyltransferase [Aerococcaceae bacterium]